MDLLKTNPGESGAVFGEGTGSISSSGIATGRIFISS